MTTDVYLCLTPRAAGLMGFSNSEAQEDGMEKASPDDGGEIARKQASKQASKQVSTNACTNTRKQASEGTACSGELDAPDDEVSRFTAGSEAQREGDSIDNSCPSANSQDRWSEL
eukprot:CAMPEP_0206540632 /NCGR_PEP_ID=MMETSP0325_2-20121206/9115_1 /ASSEMBLY_ACC=CAM_ASM_000347 /TAXON_ID=2866 /ORGANISM="Crypthecodinium cohnii, Strain Seligo" /LENGTH=114 /DNA_ID=CAMNT_0054038381 /DNA_START=15 /DNA_END=364 /DNA_ORIENTATION=-